MELEEWKKSKVELEKERQLFNRKENTLIVLWCTFGIVGVVILIVLRYLEKKE